MAKEIVIQQTNLKKIAVESYEGYAYIAQGDAPATVIEPESVPRLVSALCELSGERGATEGAFAEWCCINGWRFVGHLFNTETPWVRHKYDYKTTAELIAEFRKEAGILTTNSGPLVRANKTINSMDTQTQQSTQRRSIDQCIDQHYAEATEHDRGKLIAFANDWTRQVVEEEKADIFGTDFKSRLLKEKQQLDDRIGKLESFINGDKFATVSQVQQRLLKNQHQAMIIYADVLTDRIADIDAQQQ